MEQEALVMEKNAIIESYKAGTVTTKEDFQTQILKKELKESQAEVLNLQETIKLLQLDKENLENKLNNDKPFICPNCFPVLPHSPGSTNHISARESIWQKPKSTVKPTRDYSNFKITSSNRFEALLVENVEETYSNIEIVQASLHNKEKENNKILKNKSKSREVKKMLLCTDSHGRDLAWNINQIQKIHDAVGFVKPNGRAKHVLSHYNIKGEKLNKNDILVLACGTNDIAANEAQQAIGAITETIDTFGHMKVILVDVPNRYDLKNWSCVNKEIAKTNDTLREICLKYANVTLVEASKAGRTLHTRHGMHLNWRGKIWLAQKICEAATMTHKTGTFQPQTLESCYQNGNEEESPVAAEVTCEDDVPRSPQDVEVLSTKFPVEEENITSPDVSQVLWQDDEVNTPSPDADTSLSGNLIRTTTGQQP